MKVKLHVLYISILVMLTSVSNAQIYADSLISSFGVSDADNAVSKNDSDYASINTPVGVSNSSFLTVGFSQHGVTGMTCGFTLQQDNGLLSADVLNSMTIYLYNSKNQQIAAKSGFSFSDVDVLDDSGSVYTFRLYVPVSRNVYDIGYAKIKLGGLVSVNNKLRIYNSLLRFDCPNFDADSLVSSLNVRNPANAVSASKNDYALLTPPLLAGTSNLSVYFPDVENKTSSVVFAFGKGNTAITTNLLTNLNLFVYDSTKNILAADSGFTSADVDLFDSNNFALTVHVPANYANRIAGASIQFSGVANVNTTLRVYSVYIKSGTASAIAPTITPNGGTLCDGQSLYLRARTQASDIMWQWYYNNTKIANATRVRYLATNPGNYFVITQLGSCSGIAPQVTIKNGNCLDGGGTHQAFTLKTYPNPFISYTILSLKDIHTNAVISVIDKSSNIVECFRTSGAVDIRLLQSEPPGLYFIKVTTKDGKFYSTRVLKQ